MSRTHRSSRSPGSAPARPSRAVRWASPPARCVLVLTGCQGLDDVDTSPGGGASPSADANAPATGGGSGAGTSPLANPKGTKPGLARLTSAEDRAAARRLISRVPTASPGSHDGYERDAFGYAWKDTVDEVPLGRNGCDTRNDILARDGRALRFRDDDECVVTAMRLFDPYTGEEVNWRKEKATEVQIDHVVPLSYAWRFGAATWSTAQRERLANDPLNLLPVDGSANGGKSDAGPAEWLPPDRHIRCSYATRFAQVALAYALPVSAQDKRAMRAQCQS